MIDIDFTPEDIDALHRERFHHPHPRVQEKIVLLQPEMEKRHVRVILQLGRSFSDAKAPQELHAP